MKILNKFIWSKKEPSNKNDIWFDGSTWRMYTEEAWQSFTLPVDAADKVAKVLENASEVYQEKLNAGYGIIIEGNTISVDDSILYDDRDVWEAIETLQQNKVEQIQLNDYVPLDRYSSTAQVLIDNISELNSTKLNKTDVATINGQSLIEGGNIVIEGGDSSHNIGSIDLFEQIIAQKQNHNLTLEDKEAILNGKVITTSVGEAVVPTIGINSIEGLGHMLMFHFNERLYSMCVMWNDDRCYINGFFSFSVHSKLYADSELSETSENAVQNKVVTEKLAELSDGKEDKANKTTTLSSASTDTQYPSAKAVYGALPTLETLPNGNLKVTINGVSKGFMPATPSGDPMHYTYVAAGCVYNEETNLWSYGGPDIEGSIKYLDDLTTKDVRNAYMVFPSFSHITPFKGMWGLPIVKTRFVFCRLSKAAIVIDGAFQQNANLEFIYSDTDIIPSSMIYCLYECKSLRYLHARMQMQYITAQSALTMAFAGCNKLETIKLFKIKHSYDFKDSSLLSNDSILYMIKNEGATSAIAITLHADAYARAMADAEITAALAAHPNVSLAKA